MDRHEIGIWKPDKELAAALIDNRAMLALVSIERVWSELERIILGTNAGIVLARMNRDGVLPAIIGYSVPLVKFELLTEAPRDLEARIAILLSSLKSLELNGILTRLKASNKTIKRAKLLHFLIHNIPHKNELRLYRKVIGDEVKTHSALLSLMDSENELVERALEYPKDVDCLIDGEWLMAKTGLNPGMRLGRLKDWLYRIQIERGYTSLSQIETALCTITWNHGEPEDWPKPIWP